MISWPAHWPCDPSLRVELEGTGEDHGQPGSLEELSLSSGLPEQKPTGLCRQGEKKSPICLAAYTFNLQPTSARILHKTIGVSYSSASHVRDPLKYSLASHVRANDCEADIKLVLHTHPCMCGYLQ